MYLTQLNSSYVLVSLLIPHLEGEVVGVVAALVDPESDVPARVAARDPGMPVPAIVYSEQLYVDESLSWIGAQTCGTRRRPHRVTEEKRLHPRPGPSSRRRAG